MAVTIGQVARAAGVSRSTVSLVLQDDPRVASATRAHVRETMARLGYRPNPMAAGLRTRRSNMIGLIVSDLTYPHHALIAMGAEDVLEQAGLSLVVANSHGSLDRERRLVEALRRSHVDGLLITPLEATATSLDHLSALNDERYPFVEVYRELPGLRADYCGVDVRAAAEEITGYLAGTLGHRQIALMVSDPTAVGAQWRIEGWQHALAAHGLSAPEELLITGAGGGAGGEAAVGTLLERGTPFTAVLCSNDLVAQGALRGLHRAGRRVPEEVSVAGIGFFGEYVSPEKPLTTVGFDYRGIGQEAAALLLTRIGQTGGASRAEKGASSPPDATGAAGSPEVERRLLPGWLHVGETTAPLPPSPADVSEVPSAVPGRNSRPTSAGRVGARSRYATRTHDGANGAAGSTLRT
jgi:LacI family transcriptional regulator